MLIDLHDTFSPGQEILEPNKFAGRKRVIEKAVVALQRKGTSLMIYGKRGVGKTSFVEMIKLIARDQVELLHRYEIPHLRPSKGFQYQVISLECTDDVKNIEDVLQRLITSPEGIAGLIGPMIEKIEMTAKNHLTVDLFKKLVSFGEVYEEKLTKARFKEISVVELFTNLVLLILQDVLRPDEGLLIAIDEFDIVKDSSGLASIIKTLSKNKVKFLISGIAESYVDLIKHHASIERQLMYGRIRLDPMTSDEIENIFELAEEHNRSRISFEKGFKEEVKRKSYGYPYYVQAFGQIALDYYSRFHSLESKARIKKEHFIQGLKDFAEYEPKLDQIYIALIGSDPRRELVLKALSLQVPHRIEQDSAFSYCRKRGLTGVKRILPILLGFNKPKVLERIDRDSVCFLDSLFKVFASIRTPILLSQKENGYQLPIDH